MTDRYRFERFELAVAERQLTIGGAPAGDRRTRVRPPARAARAARPGRRQERAARRSSGRGWSSRKTTSRSRSRPCASCSVPSAIATVAGARLPIHRRASRRGDRAFGRRAAAGGHADTTCRSRAPASSVARRRSPTARGCCATSRLITLSGIGGCGKTRLAQELARQQLDAFADGVWFVDLAPLQDGERVAAVVAATLGVADDRRRLARGPPGRARGDAPPPDRARQLRARHRRRRRGRRDAARREPGAAARRHQPRGVRHRRRADLPGAVAGAAGVGRARRRSESRGRADLRRPGATGRARASRSMARTRRRSPRSVAASTASRWRSSSPRHGSRCSRSTRSGPASTIAFAC